MSDLIERYKAAESGEARKQIQEEIDAAQDQLYNEYDAAEDELIELVRADRKKKGHDSDRYKKILDLHRTFFDKKLQYDKINLEIDRGFGRPTEELRQAVKGAMLDMCKSREHPVRNSVDFVGQITALQQSVIRLTNFCYELLLLLEAEGTFDEKDASQ